MVDALRRIHAALVPGAPVIDTQPISTHPPVKADGCKLGTLDMTEWGRTIDAVDRLVAQAVHDGLYAVSDERHFLVTDTFDSGAQFAQTTSSWRGTRLAPALRDRAVGAAPPVTVDQEVRLRLLRAL